MWRGELTIGNVSAGIRVLSGQGFHRECECFVAIRPCDSAQEYLAAVRREYVRVLKDHGLERMFRWVHRKDWHITLRFLGETSQEETVAISRSLEAISKSVSPFETCVGRPGGFPSISVPRVFWVGVEGDVCALTQLQHRVEEAAVRSRFRSRRT